MLQLQNEDGTAATHFRRPPFAFPLCYKFRVAWQEDRYIKENAILLMQKNCIFIK
jgi:hypothetical protein